MSFLLVTRARASSIEGLVGQFSHDDEADDVRQFCLQWRLPYSERFRSIFVYRQGEDPDPPSGLATALNGYGTPFLLKSEAVLPDLRVVCSQDIQNAAANAVEHPSRAETIYREFEDLTTIDVNDREKREAALHRGLDRRQRSKYVEARVFRALSRADVVRRLPSDTEALSNLRGPRASSS